MSSAMGIVVGIVVTVVLAVITPITAIQQEIFESHQIVKRSPSEAATPRLNLGLVSRDECSSPPPNVYRAGRMSTYPPEMVVIDQTGGPACNGQKDCCQRVAKIADRAFNKIGLSDLGHHFYIGSDGTVYEGRKSDLYGAHTPGYNCKSYGIAFIGNFNQNKPGDAQVQAALTLLDKLVQNNLLASNYTVYSHRSTLQGQYLSRTTLLDELVSTWPHKGEQPLPERCVDSKVPVAFRRLASTLRISDSQWEIMNDARRLI